MAPTANLNSIINKLINLGVTENLSVESASRIKIINKFNFLCICYSFPYILFSISFNFYGPALVFFIGQILYCFSLYANKNEHYNFAKFLIIFSTNFSVFYLSLFYGFDSGFHLYYFTSPLIVFSFFNLLELKKIVYGITLYLISIAILVYFNHYQLYVSHEISQELEGKLYFINVFLAMSFCLLLVTHFSSFNKKINLILAENNQQLQEKHLLLESEIIDRKATEVKLQTLLKDKEILLSETHHRVKNNLAVVSGMLDLQVLMTKEESTKAILSDSRSRIKSMSLIHESLYKYDNVSQIEFGRYIYTLCEDIKNTYVSTSLSAIGIDYELEIVNLNVTKAIPCGLLVNEVLTNSFKHAFAGKPGGKINVSFKQNDNTCVLEIKDDGIGINVNEANTSSQSIGMTLIDAFVKQLKGKHEFINDNGTKLKLTFES
jgi:two-component sensor histidine kinase